MSFDELLKFAYTGPNALIFGFLNVIAFAAHRVARISETWTLAGVAVLGGALGGMGAFVEATATVGIDPLKLYYAGLVGIVIGCGSSILIGWPLSKAMDAAGFWPVSDQKVQAEAYRDPLNPASPKDA